MLRIQVFAFILLVMLVGCSNSTDPQADPQVTVTGVVTQIDDQVPVDGGVTIALKLDGGGAEVLHFGSLFTEPPPGEERFELYQKIVKAKPGNHVRATGIRGEHGIELTDLVILQ